MSDRSHWDRIYGTRRDEDLSWHEEEPSLSLELIREACALPCRVIDVGGGSSVLAQRLVTEDRAEVTVLDISETALEKARARAGHEASSIRWIAA
ncbi:MAG: class I SAM-dependent methyltransferase, partial [Actinobacteria bacterium]|nr:class I SAM-dependent methyltransferase [Actinomycetota bacterium]